MRRTVKVGDRTTLTLPVTEENQALYLQPRFQRPGGGFPLMKFMVIGSLRSGAVLHTVRGNFYQNEMRLFHAARPILAPNDIVIYGQAAGHFVGAAQVRAQGADLMAEAARQHTVLLKRISFTGTLDAFRHFSAALACCHLAH